MTSRDNNRVVRPFDWGLDWTTRWPGIERFAVPQDQSDRDAMLAYIVALNNHLAENSDEFFAYDKPKDFHIERRKVELFHTGSEPPKKLPKDEWGQFLRFTSAVPSPYPENNLVNARWFPAKGHRAVVLLPQWNADGVSQNALCRIFNLLGIAALRLSMPYHDIRRPNGLTRADYAVSANVGRTIDATRQAVADIRSCMDWLEQKGYSRLGIVGTSLGSVPRVPGQRPRRAYPGQRLQSRVDGVRRCGLDGPINPAHTAGPGRRAVAGRVAAGVAVHQPDCLF